MIRIERATQPEPAALERRYRSGEFKDMTEAERVAKLFEDHVTAGSDPVEFSFDYKVYKDKEVKTALHALFKGKCAYCESRYAGTQPMDVEHWRPKGEVHEGSGTPAFQKLAGYHWLASAWENLFPSCVDCNRERAQTNFVTNEEKTLGKANQFPVEGGARFGPPPDADGAPTGAETPLILDPCLDDPADHLRFRLDGSVAPASNSQKGQQSIDVYALNRTELAIDRLSLIKLMEQRLDAIERIATVIDRPDLPADIKTVLEELLVTEIDALEAMADPDRAFSAVARAFLDEHSPVLS